jgi:hypothetical protein
VVAKAEIEAEEIRGAARVEVEDAAQRAVDVVAKAEVEAEEIRESARAEADQIRGEARSDVKSNEAAVAETLERSQAQARATEEAATRQARDLIGEAEREAAQLRAAAEAQREAERIRAEERVAAITDAAEAKAAEIIAAAEQKATDLSEATKEDLTAEQDDILRRRAELAAEQDAVAMERQTLEADKDLLQNDRDWVDKQRAEIDEANTRISRKTEILAEAQEAFITERTLLQRRWAETERQGVEALERAHREAEGILREARTEAAQVEAAPGAGNRNGDAAEEALAQLGKVLGETRQDVAARTSAEAAEHGHDNETVSSGEFHHEEEPVEGVGADAMITFGAADDGLVDTTAEAQKE